MRIFPKFLGLGALAFIAILLGSCTVVVDEEPGRPLPPRPDRPQFCTQQYQPVCAARGDRRRTFPNACFAEADGFRPIHPGECRAEPSPRPDRPQACTREYAPVCGARGDRRRTFPNACIAQSEGYRPLHPGECRGAGGPPQSDRPQACTMEYAPVCARRGDRVRTFGNACQARADGYSIIRRGEC